MDSYRKELIAQRNALVNMLAVSEKNLKKLANVENTKVRITKSNGSDQFYIWKEVGKYEYVPAHKRELIRPLLQKNYEEKINRKLKNLLKELERFLDKYDFDEIQRIYCNACDARKKYVTPIVESDDEYIERWLTEHRGNQNDYYGEGFFPTDRGDNVRSKSEKIIADLLYKYDIPYQYEPEIRFDNGSQYFPDFAILNVTQRKTIYWEHLGRVDYEDYCVKNMRKLLDYDRVGYVLGDNLIITLESAAMPLDVKRVDEIIQKNFIYNG